MAAPLTTPHALDPAVAEKETQSAKRRLVTLEVDATDADASGYEPVWKDGKLIGLSTWIAYTANEGKMLTLAMVDEEFAEPGTEVDFIWGEPDGGTTKPTVEKHRQITIKGVVAAVPYSEVARTSYAPSWRNKAA